LPIGLLSLYGSLAGGTDREQYSILERRDKWL